MQILWFHDRSSVIKCFFFCTFYLGQYFGESALLTEENRSANVIVESQNVSVLMLDRQAFNSLVGSIADVSISISSYHRNTTVLG